MFIIRSQGLLNVAPVIVYEYNTKFSHVSVYLHYSCGFAGPCKNKSLATYYTVCTPTPVFVIKDMANTLMHFGCVYRFTLVPVTFRLFYLFISSPLD